MRTKQELGLGVIENKIGAEPAHGSVAWRREGTASTPDQWFDCYATICLGRVERSAAKNNLRLRIISSLLYTHKRRLYGLQRL